MDYLPKMLTLPRWKNAQVLVKTENSGTEGGVRAFNILPFFVILHPMSHELNNL